MNITKTIENNKLTLGIEGRLDTNTSPALLDEFNGASEGISDVVIDLSKLEYISSAGLRVLLSIEKAVKSKGNLTVTNVSDEVMEVFELTGFTDILNIE